MDSFITWLKGFWYVFFTEAQAAGPTKDWSKNLPPWTSQYSVPNRLDVMDCLSESLINIVYMVTGFDASPRALAKLSNTTEAGNYQDKVLQAANTFGLIPYELWPTPEEFDWDSYYNEIPPEILAKAVKVKITIRPADLSKSPLWTILRFPNGAQHGVAQINLSQYFDSELGSPVKALSYGGAEVTSQLSLTIEIKSMQLINDNGTWKLVGDRGYIGIADPIALARLQQVTSSSEAGSPGVPQVAVFKSVNIDKNTSLSILVKD